MNTIIARLSTTRSSTGGGAAAAGGATKASPWSRSSLGPAVASTATSSLSRSYLFRKCI